jgi:hypothetical protein
MNPEPPGLWIRLDSLVIGVVVCSPFSEGRRRTPAAPSWPTDVCASLSFHLQGYTARGRGEAACAPLLVAQSSWVHAGCKGVKEVSRDGGCLKIFQFLDFAFSLSVRFNSV